MPGFDGTGPRGIGPMTGGGGGYCSTFGLRTVWQPYGGFRRAPYGYIHHGTYGFRPSIPRITHEQELEFLKREAEALRNELKELEKEIGELSIEKK